MQKSHLPYRRIDQLKMATDMLDPVDDFFGPPIGVCIALAAIQQIWEPERLRVLVLVGYSPWSSSIYEHYSKK